MCKELNMKNCDIPQDDLLDFIETTESLQFYISNVLKENNLEVGISSLMNASISCIIKQCTSVEEAIDYRNILIQIFDIFIDCIELNQD